MFGFDVELKNDISGKFLRLVCMDCDKGAESETISGGERAIFPDVLGKSLEQAFFVGTKPAVDLAEGTLFLSQRMWFEDKLKWRRPLIVSSIFRHSIPFLVYYSRFAFVLPSSRKYIFIHWHNTRPRDVYLSSNGPVEW